MDKLISIIVPMYNEVKNIQNCLDVLIKQSCQSFHVIFVDDGSTDGTYDYLIQILEQSDTKFSHEILRQSNAGAAKARENGINKAQTEYVMIFDCDDRISENTIEMHINTILNENNVDVIMPDVLVEGDGSYKNFIFYNNEMSYIGLECLEHSLGSWGVHGWVCVKKSIFKQSYNQYRKYNPEDKNFINNDEVITRLNFFFSKKVVRNHAIYFYQNNLDSTTKKINQNRYLMLHNAIILYELFGENMGRISRNAQRELVSSLWGTTLYMVKYNRKLNNTGAWIEAIYRCRETLEQSALSWKCNIKTLLSFFILFVFRK